MRKLLSLVLLGGAIALTSCSGTPEAAEPASTSPVATSAESASADPVADSGEAAPNTEIAYFEESGIAISGADPVAYFTESAYVPGSDEFTQEWQGVTWKFASAENRDAFVADPDAYAPQYGGFCAYAVSQGYTAKIEPDAWRIVDGKLYLNFDQKIQKRWEKDIPGHIASANQNWPGVLN